MMLQGKQEGELQERNEAKNEIIFSKVHFLLGLSPYPMQQHPWVQISGVQAPGRAQVTLPSPSILNSLFFFFLPQLFLKSSVF